MKKDFVNSKERLGLTNFEIILNKIKLLIRRKKIISLKKSTKRKIK